MSRIIEQIATVQFQVQTRQASATMQALQEAAKDLAKDMDSVNEKIAALGKDVPEDNPQLLNYQNMLRSIKKDYDDVMKAQRDFMRGAKAADQLWKAAQEQKIESLSFRSIKSGISGLRKRQEGLSAGDAKDMQDWRIIQNVIQEADRIVKEATADVQNTIQVIRDGGKVSEQAMRQTINALRDLRSSVDETDADFHKWGSDLDFMEGKLKDFTDAQRRARGEMVDANDARKEMEKLTKAGAEAAEESRKAAEKEIKTLEEKGKTLAANREEIKQNIEATRKEIDEQHKLIEKKHSELAAAERARKIVFDADRAHIEGLQTQAEKERALANEKSDAAEKQRRYTDLLQQQTDALGQKVVSLQEKLAKVNEPVKPKVDSSEIDALKQKLEELKTKKESLSQQAIFLRDDKGYSDVEIGERNLYAAIQTYGKEKGWKRADLNKELKEGINSGDTRFLEILAAQIQGTTEDAQKLILSLQESRSELKLFSSVSGEFQGGLSNVILGPVKEGVNAFKKNAEVLGELKEKESDYLSQKIVLENEYKAILQEETDIKGQLNTATQQSTEANQVEAKSVDELEGELEQLNKKIKTLKTDAMYDSSEGSIDDAIKDRLGWAKKYSDEADAAMKKGSRTKEGSAKNIQYRDEWESADQFRQSYEDQAAALQKLEPLLKRKAEIEQQIAQVRSQSTTATEKSIDVDKRKAEAIQQLGEKYHHTAEQTQALSELADKGEMTTSEVQRKLSVGYNQATDIVETLKSVTTATEESIAATKEENQATETQEELEGQLAETKKQHEKSQKELNKEREKSAKLQGEAIEQDNKAADAEGKVADATSKATEAQAKHNKKMEEGLQDVKEMENAQTDMQIKLDGQEKQLKENGEAYSQNAQDITAAEAKKKQARGLTMKQLETIIALYKKQHDEELEANTDAWREKGAEIERLTKILNEWKGAPVLQMMTDRMQDVGSLSKSALEETRKFWEAMAQGADKGSEKLATAEAHIKALVEEEQKRNLATMKASSDRLSGNLGLMSQGDIRQAIEDAKKYQLTLGSTSEEAKKLAQAIVNAEEHIKKYGVEAQRVAVREAQEAREAKQAFEDAVAGKFDKASMEELDEVIKKIKEYQATIKDPTGDGAQAFNDAKVQIDTLSGRLNTLKGVAEKVTGTFAGADDVLARWAEHMNAGKQATEAMSQQTETLAQTLDDKLAGATSSWDDFIERDKEHIKRFNDDLKEITEDLDKMEKELAELEQKHANSSWFRKQTRAYKREGWRIEDLRDAIGREQIDDEGNPFTTGAKGIAAWYRDQKKYWEDELKDNMQRKAAELGITESINEEVAAEEKKADAKKLTNEQMQQGIKLLEEEYAKTDHTTEEGIKRREQLRSAIEQMNEEIKISTGEWMSLGDAMKLAEQAEKNVYLNKDGAGFTAMPQDIQKATQALERQRDALLQTIKAKRDNKNLTEEEKAALDKEEAELTDLTNKLKALKFEQDNFNMSQAKMQALMETPKNAVNLEELRAAIKRADGELHRMQNSLGENSKEYQEFAGQVKNAKNVLKEMEGQAKATASAWDKAWSRLKTYVGMYMGFNMLWGKITGTFDDLMTLSDKMGEVQKTTNLSADAVGKLSRNLAGLDVRTPLSELMAISASAGQLGLKTEEDIQGFTEAANKMMIALPEMGKEATTEMMRVAIATGEVEKIGKEMQQGLVEGSSATAVAMEKIASTIDRLRANSASTAPEITDFVKRVGAVGAQSGISIDQVAALGSTISSLGMRVEMSATALSRMIPAIKNNAFAVAKAIGVTPDTLRDLFEAGRGMEAILMIFQKIKDSNMDADSIEKLLGMGGMQDIMKQLNQQGARAGIVFAGLSQNVDELRKQLVTANEAYEENTAIQKEFDRMNDTTAAKLERLKNRIQEMFVGDTMQRLAGGLISVLDALAKMIADNGPVASGVKALGVAFLALKIGVGEAMKALGLWFAELGTSITKAGTAMKSFSSANWWGALATVIVYLGIKIYDWATSIDVVANEMAKLDQEIKKQTDSVDKLFHAVTKSNVVLEAARNKLEEVAKAGGDATEAENALKKASTEHAATIREINSKYGSYLGYMLSETSSAEQLARARELINAKLRETITLKQQEAALGNVEQEFGGKVNKKGAAMESTINTFFGKNYEAAARVSIAINEAAQKYSKNSEQFEKEVRKIINANFVANRQRTKQHNKNALANMTDRILSDAEDYREAIEEYAKQEAAVNNRFEARRRESRKTTRTAVAKDLNAILADWKTLVDDYRKAEGKEKERLAVEVYKQQRSYANAIANNADYLTDDKRKAVYEKNLANMATYEKGLRKVAGEAIRTVDAMERAETKITGTDFTNGGESGNNPWGKALEAESTDWKNMTAEQLVARRKQMKDFVNAIQTDTDVQAVLKEDAALKKAIEKGMSSDMRTVIEWYNTERLKIQDELHARHLTNTGDWQDPKKQKARQKQFTDEMKAYLEELDAYYTERNQRIQSARNEEEITEGEAWRQTIENESEWHQRRAELQKMYSNKSAEVVKDEQEAIHSIIAKRTGDDVAYIEKSIQKTKQFAEQVRKADPRGEDEYRKWQADLGLGWEKDFMKQTKAIGKQVKFMTETLAKERPFNGITENLELNLTKMGILVGNVPDKMHFLLGQIEDAYTLDVKQMVDRVAQAGFTEWAKQLQGDVSMQQAMLAQLRTAYEAVQEAIRKEGARIKKDADMMWKLALTPDGKNLKQEIDAALGVMTQQQEAVSRANSLIGAGSASENVASRIAIKQMQLQLSVQQAQFALMRKMGDEKAQYLDQLAEQYEKENKLKEAERARLDAENVRKSLDIAITEEKKKQAEITKQIAKEQEEIQNRLYKDLRELTGLLTKGLQSVFEAVNFYNSSDYNNLAVARAGGSFNKTTTTTVTNSSSSTTKNTSTSKHTSTGASQTTSSKKTEQGSTAAKESQSKSSTSKNSASNTDTYTTSTTTGTKTSTSTREKQVDYYIIENAGTKDAVAVPVSMTEEEYYEKKIELDRDNAIKEAWKNLLDDLNMKMSETIADQINAMFQDAAVNANTDALGLNTAALAGLTAALTERGAASGDFSDAGKLARDASGMALDESGNIVYPIQPTEGEEQTPLGARVPTREDWEQAAEGSQTYWNSQVEQIVNANEQLSEAGVQPLTPQMMSEEEVQAQIDQANTLARGKMDAENAVTANKIQNDKKRSKSEADNDGKMTTSAGNMYAKMTQAANLYGIAYQAMSNDNLSTAQKFEIMAIQAAGQAAIAALTTNWSKDQAQVTGSLPAILAECLKISPLAGAAIFAGLTAVLGSLMGIATSKISKSKSEIAQATGASTSGTAKSISAGKLMTGMLTYGEGNVNEFTDPSSLTPGRSYNVDSADGRTYRAKYMGVGAKTHLTNGPEFHLVGERGREAIIDAHTTRLLQMDDTGIWQAIQTLYNGGSLRHSVMRRKGRGMAAFADGNIDEFETMADGGGLMAGGAGFSPEQMMALQASIDRQSDLLERAMTDGIHAYFDVYGRGGLIDSYDTGKKTVTSHGEKY